MLATLTNAAVATRRPILDLDEGALKAWLAERGWPAHHGRQLRRWLLAARADSFDAMTDLPKRLRQELAEGFRPLGTEVACHQQAADGTHKLLLRLEDGQHIECVLLQEDQRRTVCISTQVGCGMGCVFCASGLNGVVRNLHPYEILEQVVRLRNLLPASERLTHVVVMGMGEPLANLDNLLAALAVVGAKDGLDIGARHVTISTVGLPAKIRRLADLRKQYHLAISLHAPDDQLRTRIVPTNDKTGLTDILAAADYFFAKTKRQLTFEYVLLGGINDGPEQARALARVLSKRPSASEPDVEPDAQARVTDSPSLARRAQRRAQVHPHVNLIPFNEVQGLPYRRPSDEAITRFIEILRTNGISVKVRKRKGSEIDAACGQLRRRLESAPAETSLATSGLTR